MATSFDSSWSPALRWMTWRALHKGKPESTGAYSQPPSPFGVYMGIYIGFPHGSRPVWWKALLSLSTGQAQSLLACQTGFRLF